MPKEEARRTKLHPRPLNFTYHLCFTAVINKMYENKIFYAAVHLLYCIYIDMLLKYSLILL